MNPYEKKNIKPHALQWMRVGEIRPAGWMRAQMQHDLEDGFVGHLDELVPDLIVNDDIYGANRLTKAVRTKELGVVSQEKDWEAQFLWWNSETQSNWRDGLVRTTLLLDHPDYLPRVRAYIEKILATQDADGYLGIYAPDLRFNFDGENGELWAQASLFRVLLGYYEAVGDELVLASVRRAVDVTMRAYPPNRSKPFTVKNDYAGVCHGLVFTDALDRLYQLTGQASYLDYALWLYQEYSENQLSADDIQYKNLIDPSYRFKAHGAHTYEHLRSLLTAVYASGNALLEKALEAYLVKLNVCLTPSGAPIGDEMIDGRPADASETGYEYCSIHELLDSYSNLLQKTGDLPWADRLERLLFNAAQGARHPRESAIAYLKTDNSFSMTGTLHPHDTVDEKNPQTRYKYSPAHQDVAVCCVPNAGRIYPYYVKAMWLRCSDGLVAALYGASELVTEINGARVRIKEETNYPFELQITFIINAEPPVEFDLAFRKPAWATGFELNHMADWREENGMIKVKKVWQSEQQITISFKAEIQIKPFSEKEYYLSHGPLVYALPLEGVETEGRKYKTEGFRDLYYSPLANLADDWQFIPNEDFHHEESIPSQVHAWEVPPALAGNMMNISTHKKTPVRLLPIGSSILRKTTFRMFE